MAKGSKRGREIIGRRAGLGHPCLLLRTRQWDRLGPQHVGLTGGRMCLAMMGRSCHQESQGRRSLCAAHSVQRDRGIAGPWPGEWGWRALAAAGPVTLRVRWASAGLSRTLLPSSWGAGSWAQSPRGLAGARLGQLLTEAKDNAD